MNSRWNRSPDDLNDDSQDEFDRWPKGRPEGRMEGTGAITNNIHTHDDIYIHFYKNYLSII